MDMPSNERRSLKHTRHNPFAGGREHNPLSSIETATLVKVPDAPETHERRAPRRNYLSASVGPLDNLFGMLDGKQPQVPRKIEVTRTVREEAEDEDAAPAPGDGPPKYGR